MPTGPNNPGTVADDASFGAQSWSNTAFAVSSNNSYATATSGFTNVDTHYITFTNFGFAIPGGDSISEIRFECERKASGGGTVVDKRGRIIKAGTIGTIDFTSPANWATSDEVIIYAGLFEGTTSTPADVNNSGFGWAISANLSAPGTTANIDVLTCTITSGTAPTTSLQYPSFQGSPNKPVAAGWMRYVSDLSDLLWPERELLRGVLGVVARSRTQRRAAACRSLLAGIAKAVVEDAGDGAWIPAGWKPTPGGVLVPGWLEHPHAAGTRRFVARCRVSQRRDHSRPIATSL